MTNFLKKFNINSEFLAEGRVMPPSAKGRTLLLDGDPLCYVAVNNVVKLDTAIRRFEQDILEKMYLTGCDNVRVHLTPRGSKKNGRLLLNTVKPYQGNRVGVVKSPILEPLRSGAVGHLRHNNLITVLPQWEIEADDGLVIDSYSIPNSVLVSIDKDLSLTPYEDYVLSDGIFRKLPEGDTFGYIKMKYWVTAKGNPRSKVVGKGTKFFFAQLLMGDAADNIKGIITVNGKACGAATAFKYLEDFTDESECADWVIKQYRRIHQNIIPEAEALWMLRSFDDSAYKYLTSLDVTAESRSYLTDCYSQCWRNTDES